MKFFTGVYWLAMFQNFVFDQPNFMYPVLDFLICNLH